MHKALTLLETLIISVIIGILAVIGLTFFKNLSEKARIAEAKVVLAQIREAEITYLERTGICTNRPQDLILDLDSRLWYNVTVDTVCSAQNISYFRYCIVCNSSLPQRGVFYVNAVRCDVGGKPPAYPSSYSIRLWQDGTVECFNCP